MPASNHETVVEGAEWVIIETPMDGIVHRREIMVGKTEKLIICWKKEESL